MELLLQAFHLLLELFHTFQQELVDIVKDNYHRLVPDFVNAVLVERVPKHCHLVELVSEHVPIFDIEEVNEEVDLKHSALNQISR